MINNLKDLLTYHEGRKNHAYPDVDGNPTIGIGCRCDSLNTVWSDDEIDANYNYNVNQLISEFRSHFVWFSTLSQVRKDALIDVAYNLGFYGFEKFHHTINALASGDFNLAADELLDSDAARKLPTRYGELADMIRNNYYPSVRV